MESQTYYDAFTGKQVRPPAGTVLSVDDGSASSYIVGPALFDPQVNGFAGIDFQAPTLSRDELEFAVMSIRKAGCAHLLLTLITNSPEFLADQFAGIAGHINESSILRESILGFHLEGPFISPRPGYIGAHSPEFAIEPRWDLFAQWQAASGDRIRMITLAPELRDSVDFIRRANEAGGFVCAGHSDAALDDLAAASNAGLRMFTHLGNGCPAELHRHDNIIQRVLACPQLLVSVIPDGIHLPAPVLANFVGSLGGARLVMTTDAISAAGAPAGSYRLGAATVVVGADRVVMNPGGTNFAGSSLTMIEGIYNTARFGGMGFDGAWRAWTHLRALLFPRVRPPLLKIPFPEIRPMADKGQDDE